MGNSTSHEQRIPEPTQSETVSATASEIPSPSETPDQQPSSDNKDAVLLGDHADNGYFPPASTSVTIGASARRPKSIMSTESLDSQPAAQHREDVYDADDDMIDSERLATGLQHINENHVEHAENVSVDLQRVRLSDTADDTSVTDKAAVDTSIPAKPVSKMLSGEEIDFYYGQPSQQAVPTVISWIHGGKKVYVTGTFTGWRKMIKLAKKYVS